MDRLTDPSFTARAAARRSWRIQSFKLGNEPGDDLSATTSAAERIEMMWPLACEAWSFAGRSIPDYPRSETPLRLIHDTTPTWES